MDCTPSGLTEGAKEVKIRELNETLCDIAREGDLDALYEALKRDPEVLDKIDKIPFVQTPLHEAVCHTPLDEDRRTEFALELLNLKPSFGRKLNPDGESPLHLAVRKGSPDLAKRLIKYDSELIRVKGRGRKTPLHLVAETGDSKTETNLLAEFLFACPESIKDLTIRDETAFHLAVKQRQVKAFKLIFEWMWRSYNGDLLIWKDHHGNTVLHIAASTNQLDIVRHLVRRAPIIRIEKNSQGETALDIAQDERIKNILSGRVKVPPIREYVEGLQKNTSLDDFLLTREPCVERFLRFILYCRREMSLDMRNMVLVVAVLIATAAYQDLGNLTEIKRSGFDGNKPNYFFNAISFMASVAVMGLVFSSRPFTGFLHMSLVFLTMSYWCKMAYIYGGHQALLIWLIVPSLLGVVYGFKMLYFKNVEREIKMEMPAIWILFNFHPRWMAVPPVPGPLQRLRMVYNLMRG